MLKFTYYDKNMSFYSLNTLVCFIYLRKKTMKNKFLVIALCLVGVSANAQFTFIDSAGTPVESGSTVTYGQGQVGDPDGFYNYFVVNDAAEAIFMKAELLSVENTDGSFFEICFGLCYDEIEVGQKFPNNGSVFIEQGGQTLPGNHLGNTLANDEPRTFTFRYYQTDQAGITEQGEDFLITYSYDPTLGMEDNNAIGFDVTATLVSDYINFRSPDNYTLSIYDKRGRNVKKKKITIDTNRMPIGDLPAGMYFVRVVNDQNASKTIKIIKK
jgi:hypothetical protein